MTHFFRRAAIVAAAAISAVALLCLAGCRTKTYELSFSLGEHAGQNETVPEIRRLSEGEKSELPSAPAGEEGYRFAGWYDGETLFPEDSSYSMPAKDTKLTASWEESNPAPFALLLNGVVGYFDGEGNLVAEFLFSEGEMAIGRVNLTKDPSLNITFRYQISEEGEITFLFDTADTATGTLYGKEITITANIQGTPYSIHSMLYHLTDKTDGEITEDGYVTPGYPIYMLVSPPEGSEIVMNGEQITYSHLMQMKMPEYDVLFEITTP